MKKYKNGFTLAEVLMSLMIIGIVLVFAIGTMKAVKVSYTNLTYFAHKNVVDMVGILFGGKYTAGEGIGTKDTACENGYAKNAFKGVKCPEHGYYPDQILRTDALLLGDSYLPSMVTQCTNSNGVIVPVLKNDNELNPSLPECKNRTATGEPSNLFCKSLVALTNSTGKYYCGKDDLYAVDTTTDANAPQFESTKTGKLDPDKPNLKLTNGMRVYISKWTKNDNVSKDFGFRLVGVDLNGTQKPNTTAIKKKTPTDIVTFLVLDNGEVYPMGAAADNVKVDNREFRYLSAKVKGYAFSAWDDIVANSQGTADKKWKSYTNDKIPEECRNLKASDNVDSTYAGNTKINKFKCNFRVHSTYTYTYRQAFCKAKGAGNIGYGKYCSTITLMSGCQHSDSEHYDNCQVETIKPVFRYNF